jgi:hypothetical protein
MDSDDYTSEDNKRKREIDDMLFNKSKKTSRTPEKTKAKEEKLDFLIQLVKDLTTETKQIRADQEETKNEIMKIREENKQLLRENQEIKEEYKIMKQHNKELEIRLERLEKEKRRNNVVVNGLRIETESNKVLKEVMEELFEKKLQVKIDVKEAYKLGEETCLIELRNAQEKELIMANKYKLKKLKNERIYINQDMTRMEREKAKEIRKVAKQEMEKGKQVKVGYNKVTIDGVNWKWNMLTEKLELERSKNH